LRRRKKTMNGLTSILRGAFSLAWENGDIDTDRPRRCLHHLPSYDRPRNVFLTREECSQLIEHARPDLRDLILGALYTGCRVRELTNMLVEDVARNTFGVYIAPSKNRRPRYVFVPDEGMAFFLSLCEGKERHERVFQPMDGKPWTNRYGVLFRRLVNKTDLPKATVFHSLRHTYASQMVQAGMSMVIIAKQLGHSDVFTVSRTYGHLAPQLTEAEVHRLFAPLSEEYVQRAHAMKDQLAAVRKKIQTADWRTYASPEDSYSWPRANYSRFSGALLAQIRR
jgi:integrase/recombinase XerD